MATGRPVGRTDPRPSLHLAPPGLIPAVPQKRPPDPQAVRWRYKLVQWAAALVGGLVAIDVIVAALGNIAARKLVPDVVFYVFALLVLVVGLGVPGLVIKLLWLWKRRRHDWGP